MLQGMLQNTHYVTGPAVKQYSLVPSRRSLTIAGKRRQEWILRYLVLLKHSCKASRDFR